MKPFSNWSRKRKGCLRLLDTLWKFGGLAKEKTMNGIMWSSNFTPQPNFYKYFKIQSCFINR